MEVPLPHRVCLWQIYIDGHSALQPQTSIIFRLHQLSPYFLLRSIWVLYECGVELQLDFLIAFSTGELLRNKASPFVFRAASALSSPVHFMLDSLLLCYEKAVNVCLHLSFFLQRVFENKVAYWGGGGETASFSYVELAKCIEKHECW